MTAEQVARRIVERLNGEGFLYELERPEAAVEVVAEVLAEWLGDGLADDDLDGYPIRRAS